MNRFIPLIVVTSLGLSACMRPVVLPDTPSVFSQDTLMEGKAPPPEDKEVKSRIALLDRLPQPQQESPVMARKVFSFHARNLPVEQAMAQFAQTYGINVVIDNDVQATVTIDFRNLSLDKALEAMLETNGLSWEWNEGLLRVTRQQTKTFMVDYLRMVRSGTSSSSTTGSSSGSGGDSNTVGVSRTDSINFWDELDKQLNDILTKGPEDYTARGEQQAQETTTTTDRVTNTSTTAVRNVKEKIGRMVINRLAGTVQVTSSATRMRAVERYLETLRQNVLRQVYIDVKIIEVDLSGDNSLGVDWSKIDMGAMTLGTATALTTSASGATVPAATFTGNYNQNFSPTGLVKNITALVTALKRQGNVKVVSQPRIRTLNNQAAVVKSGTERTFYTTQTNITTTSGVSTTTTTNTPTTVTEGVILSITPQISADDRIAMDISPMITRVSGIDSSNDGNSSAPRLDVKTASTMVRVADGETVVVGGLIQESDEQTRREVPGLGSAPVVGALFGTSHAAKSRSEMVIILTPYIIR